MNEEDLKAIKIKKENMKIYSIHKSLTTDSLFFYSIYILLLTQVKNIGMQYIVFSNVLYQLAYIVAQIPATIIIEKLKFKKGMMIGDILLAISIILIMLSNYNIILYIANIVMAIGLSVKEFAEDTVLAASIPEVEEKGKLFSKAYGKGLGNYFYLSAISALISGFLYNVNPYIPMILCTLIYIVATRITQLFNLVPVNNKKIEKEIISNTNKILSIHNINLLELNMNFKFIFNSDRLKSLLLFASVMYGMIAVMNTYEIKLLDEIGISAQIIGIIYAIMQIICGISAKAQHQFHNEFRNKTLTIIGIGFTISCMICGIIATSTLPYIAILLLITFFYSIRYIDKGLYYVLIKRYISNFAGTKIVSKIYTTYSLVTGLSSCIIGILASVLIANFNIKYSMIILGTISTLAMVAILTFMRKRVGLKPSEYAKEEINYKEFVEMNKQNKKHE